MGKAPLPKGERTAGPGRADGGAVPPEIQSVKDLKDCLEALEKLKALRRDFKTRLGREGLSERDELRFAGELEAVSSQIRTLDLLRLRSLDIVDQAQELEDRLDAWPE